MAAESARLHAVVRGRVQGVYFRAHTMDRARRLGLVGWVRNRPDGRSVEIAGEGPRERLEALLVWLRQGPPGARVDAVEVEWGVASGEYQDFDMGY